MQQGKLSEEEGDLQPELPESHTELEPQGCAAVGLLGTERFQKKKSARTKEMRKTTVVLFSSSIRQLLQTNK